LIGPQLAHRSLVQLLPGMALDMPLFWTHPRSAQAALERLTHCVMAAARQWLEPENAI